jgi:hypothetical protein
MFPYFVIGGYYPKGVCPPPPPWSYLDTSVNRNIFVLTRKQPAILRSSISYPTHYADWAILAPKLHISSRNLQLDWCVASILRVSLSSVGVANQNWNVRKSVRPDSEIAETGAVMCRARCTAQSSDLVLWVSDRFKTIMSVTFPNHLKAKWNPICHLLALLARHIFHFSGLRVNLAWYFKNVFNIHLKLFQLRFLENKNASACWCFDVGRQLVVHDTVSVRTQSVRT